MRQTDISQVHPAVDIPLDYACGPAMLRLNDRQRAFVTAMLDFGGRDNTKAAEAAGYSADNRNSLRRIAYRLAHDPNIQEAIREEGTNRLNSATIMAVNTLLDIADDPSTEKKDRLKAVEMIMNRTGLHATTEHKVAVTRTDLTGDAMIARITQLAKSQGLDPQKLLGRAAPAQDAEFTEVEFDENSIEDLL
jgi:phage terminase small subunit